MDPFVLENFKNLTEKHGFAEDWIENEDNFIKCDSWFYDDIFGDTGLTENSWTCPGSAQQNLQVVILKVQTCINMIFLLDSYYDRRFLGISSFRLDL